MTAGRLTWMEARTLGLAALGGALEFYDFVVFVFFTKTLSHLFFPPEMPDWLSQLQVYGIFAAGYLARPVGGIVMAHFGDLSGRKRMFSLSVFLMAVPTLLIGLLPTYPQIGLAAPILLLGLRIVQGVAIGGEVPAAWVFVAEHVPSTRTGFACASLTSGLTAGILLGSVFASVLHTSLPPADLLDYGWRLPFLVGGVFGFMAVWLRRWLAETPVFEEMRRNKTISRELPLKRVLLAHKPAVLLSMLVTWMLTAGIVVVILMTPTLVQAQFQIEPGRAFVANSIASFCLIFGCLAGGALVDRIGLPKALFAGSLALGLSTLWLYADLAAGGANFYPLSALAGLSVGVAGIVPSVMVRAFPAPVRFSGISFSYNLAYAIFGALTPPLISYLSSHLGAGAAAHYVAFTAALGTAIAVVLHFKPSLRSHS